MRNVAGRLFVISIQMALCLMFTGCHEMSTGAGQEQKVMLWNGKDLTGWKLFVPDEGVNVNDVWSVKDDVIYCTGKPNGYMRTEEKYGNYILHLEWRWPAEPTNSGVLVHASGPDQLWPKCIECQLMAGNAGDFVLMGGVGITIDGQDKQDAQRRFVGITKKKQSSEKPAGEWNMYEIHCKADTISCYVNGVLQNSGTKATETSGWICLQSEGGPIEFRNIYIKLLD